MLSTTLTIETCTKLQHEVADFHCTPFRSGGPTVTFKQPSHNNDIGFQVHNRFISGFSVQKEISIAAVE